MRKEPRTRHPQHGKLKRPEGKAIEFGGRGEAETSFHSKITTARGFSLAKLHARRLSAEYLLKCQASTQQFLVQAGSVYVDPCYSSSISIRGDGLHFYLLPKHHLRRELFGSLSKSLPLLGTVDAVQADFPPLPWCITVMVSPSLTPTALPDQRTSAHTVVCCHGKRTALSTRAKTTTDRLTAAA